MELRLADLLASLSLVSDLGMGYAPDQAIEACLIACGLARELDLDQTSQRDVYYTTLLLHVGCTAGAHEQAALAGGDDIVLRNLGSRVFHGGQRELISGLILPIGRGKSPNVRLRTIGRLLVHGEKVGSEANRATCEVASQMARRIGLGETVRQALHQMFERWDGKGLPCGLSAEDIAIPVRVAQVASQAALFNRLGGPDLACEMIGGRTGRALDPEVSACFMQHAHQLHAEVAAVDLWEAVLDSEPRPHQLVTNVGLDRIARAFADAVDLMTPHMHGHSVEVAELAEAAGQELGMDQPAATTMRLAGLLHDLGRVGVPDGVWEKPASLTVSEWEQVRLHPYHSERILSRTPAMAEIASIAGMHHERNDGSGYYRNLPATAISMPARVLAAADAYQAMTSDRPYRRAMSPEAAAEQLAAEAETGRLDADAVRAVLGAAGQRTSSARPNRPGGLTEREIEVLRLASSGMTNREMGDALSISPKTVGHHVQHIYNKIGVSTRAAAALYAMEHNLLQ